MSYNDRDYTSVWVATATLVRIIAGLSFPTLDNYVKTTYNNPTTERNGVEIMDGKTEYELIKEMRVAITRALIGRTFVKGEIDVDVTIVNPAIVSDGQSKAALQVEAKQRIGTGPGPVLKTFTIRID